MTKPMTAAIYEGLLCARVSFRCFCLWPCLTSCNPTVGHGDPHLTDEETEVQRLGTCPRSHGRLGPLGGIRAGLCSTAMVSREWSRMYHGKCDHRTVCEALPLGSGLGRPPLWGLASFCPSLHCCNVERLLRCLLAVCISPAGRCPFSSFTHL